MNFLSSHPLDLVIILPDITKKPGQNRLIKLMAWKSWFDELALRTTIYSSNTPDQIQQVQNSLFFPFEILSDDSLIMARHYDCVLNKPVFAQVSQIIYPALILTDPQTPNQRLFFRKHVHTASLTQLVKTALKIQEEWLEKNLTLFVDIPF